MLKELLWYFGVLVPASLLLGLAAILVLPHSEDAAYAIVAFGFPVKFILFLMLPIPRR